MPQIPNDTLELEVLLMAARAHIRDVAQDRAGNILSSASVYIFADGTGVASASPSGTAVTMYTTAQGATTTTNPLTTNSDGEFEVWVDTPGPYDMVLVKNSAYVLETVDAQFRKGATERIVYVDADADTANNSLPAVWRGTKDYPYAGGAGLLLAFSDIAGTANNASVPVEVRVYGSSGVDTSPSVITLSSRLDLGIGAYLRGWGGGDADRQRAAVVITGAISGELIRVNGRYVKIEDIAVSNTHASGVGISIAATNPGGGFQMFSMKNVHVYDCGSHGVILQTFNTDLTVLDHCQFLWNGHQTSAYGLYVKDSDGTPDSSPNQVIIKDCEIAHNSEGQIGLIQGESNPTSGDGVIIRNLKAHGSRSRIVCKGWHDVSLEGAIYFETSGTVGLDTDQSHIHIEGGTGGSTRTFDTYGFTVNASGRVHGMDRVAANTTTLTAAIATTTVTTISVTSNTGFNPLGDPWTEPFTVQIDSEKLRVVGGTGGSNLTWKVIRGVDGTTAATHSNGANVTANAWTAGVGLFADVDECVGFKMRGVSVHNADSTSSNPQVVLRSNCQRSYVELFLHTSSEDRASQITTQANLWTNAGTNNHIDWWDGTMIRRSGDPPGMLQGTATWNPGNLAAVGDVELTTVTVTGARAGDPVDVSFSEIGSNKVLMFGWVSSDDTVSVLIENKEGVNLNLASGTLHVRVRRRQ